ncbi:uncharacterized protein LOC111699626 isoform X2 [Eurytemora carolleeae]|uniref:uncharacterized protein LOC111699626 isoform X2 n=1 Tax=Eurytemora carolleeae TaxID=1294199 RepID=UPI000C780E5B|nr:uncharacterized protein LOC111699626 isoform X2 [Eurytemora carolleeae]|eukprot:XP_023326114.1 uncharacterized protein LOC111699626 isoform X2 [Eurytemora affinis]
MVYFLKMLKYHCRSFFFKFVFSEMHCDSRESFLKNGFIFPVQVLDSAETEYYMNKYKEYLRRYGSQGKDGIKRIRGNRIFRLHMVAKWAADLVRHPRLIQAVSQVLNTSDILIWSSDLTVKPKRSSECFGWHQDEAYAHLGPETKLVTAWIALSDSRTENGCVKFIRGSNSFGQLAHMSRRRTEDCNLVLGQVVADQLLIQEHKKDVVDCNLLAGEASLHAWRTIHSSQPNHSDQDRIGLAVRYMAGDVVSSCTVINELVTLAAGQYKGDSFEIENIPEGEYGKEEWALHKKSMDREWERRKKSKELGLLPSQEFENRNG